MAKLKIYSQYGVIPVKEGQFFTEPSLTDQLADEPLKRIFERFVMSGKVPPLVDGDISVMASDDELDSVLADSAIGDVSQMSKLEQQDILCDAARLAERLKKESAVSANEARKSEHSATGAQQESNESKSEQKTAE